MKPLLSIVIPTWNRKDLVVDCLRSLDNQTFRDFEVIIVDDGSTDGTADLIPAGCDSPKPGVRLVRLDQNRGFCVAVNRGISEASGQWILLLNNDMTLHPDCLERLMNAAGNGDYAMLAPLVVWKDEPDRIYAAGDRIGVNGRPESIGFRATRNGFPLPEEVFGVSAGAGLFRRDLFAKIGALDERFHAYFEDSDLCFRARLAGFRARLVPEAVACHIGSASIEGRTWWRARQCFRNHVLLVVKNMPGRLLIRHAGAILKERGHQAGRLFSAARCEFGAIRASGIVLAACLSASRAMPAMLAARRRIQRTRVLPDAAVDALLRTSYEKEKN